MSLLEDLENFEKAISNKVAQMPVIEEVDNAQKSREWFRARIGKATSSIMPKFVKSGRGKGISWGDTAIGELERIACERTMTDDGIELYIDTMMSKDFYQTRWGNDNEPLAIIEFEKRTGIKTYASTFAQNPDMPYFGGSIDFLGDEFVGEVKCPIDPVKHQKNLNLVGKGIDREHEYYAQIQSHLINHPTAKFCYFVSYDPRRVAPHNIAVIKVQRDDDYIAFLIERLKEGELMINEMITNH